MELYSKEELLQIIKEKYPCGGECDHCPEVLDDGSCTSLHSIRKIIDDLKPVIIVDRELSINGERPLPLIVSDIIKDPGKDHSLEIAQKSIQLGIRLGKAEEMAARKKGEWIFVFDDKVNDRFIYKCSECGREVSVYSSDALIPVYPFCHCGAKMQKGGAEND